MDLGPCSWVWDPAHKFRTLFVVLGPSSWVYVLVLAFRTFLMGLGSSSWSWDPADPIPMLPPHGLSRDEGNGPCPAPQILGKAEIRG